MSNEKEVTNDSQRIIDFYTRVFSESERLNQDLGPLEWVRTIDIFERHLPKPLAVVIDVGGATGTYACWLLERGYEVHLIDLVPQHVEQAREFMERVAGPTCWSAALDFMRMIEEDASIIGASPHLLAIGKK